MVTMDNLEQITRKLSLEIGIPNDEVMEDISSIVYYVDVFECDGDTSIIERHIDVEYSFGEYYEVPIWAAVIAGGERNYYLSKR